MHTYTVRKLLNIPEYKVTRVISIDDKEIHIRLQPYKRKKAICSECKQEHKVGYHSSREVIVEDKPISNLKVYLHFIKRRYRCPKDNRIHTEEISWLNKWSRVTKRFAQQVNRLTAITTNQEAAWFFGLCPILWIGLDDEMVYRIDKEMLEECAAPR